MACNRSSAGVDGESSLAVVLYRPGLAVNSHNNGDSTRAVVSFLGTETNIIAQSNVPLPSNNDVCWDTYLCK